MLKKLGVGKPGSEARVVVFSERSPTLAFLKQELSQALELTSEQIDVFHGSLDDQAQQKLVRMSSRRSGSGNRSTTMPA